MDIYQIWTTYNKQWSRYEILAFMGVLILVCTAMAVCVHRKKLNIIQATAVRMIFRKLLQVKMWKSSTLVILYVRDVSLTERMPDAIWY